MSPALRWLSPMSDSSQFLLDRKVRIRFQYGHIYFSIIKDCNMIRFRLTWRCCWCRCWLSWWRRSSCRWRWRLSCRTAHTPSNLARTEPPWRPGWSASSVTSRCGHRSGPGQGSRYQGNSRGHTSLQKEAGRGQSPCHMKYPGTGGCCKSAGTGGSRRESY